MSDPFFGFEDEDVPVTGWKPPSLWVDDYRPQTLAEYVWRDPAQREQVERWVKDGGLPHLLFSGIQGTGKTSLALLLLKLLGIPECDILKINASRHRNVDDIQEMVVSFISTWAMNPTGLKYVLFDEADKMSPYAQGLLRGEVEGYSDACRFIFTCNDVKKITEALKSRCQGFHFLTLDRDDFTARAGEILMKEGIKFEVETLIDHVNIAYPDLRKCIQNLQQNSGTGTLLPFSTEDLTETKDYILAAVQLFVERKFLDARKILTTAPVDDYPDIYRFLYQNLDIWADNEEGQGEALLIIRRAIVNHTHVAAIDINLAACIVELSRLR